MIDYILHLLGLLSVDSIVGFDRIQKRLAKHADRHGRKADKHDHKAYRQTERAIRSRAEVTRSHNASRRLADLVS